MFRHKTVFRRIWWVGGFIACVIFHCGKITAHNRILLAPATYPVLSEINPLSANPTE